MLNELPRRKILTEKVCALCLLPIKEGEATEEIEIYDHDGSFLQKALAHKNCIVEKRAKRAQPNKE